MELYKIYVLLDKTADKSADNTTLICRAKELYADVKHMQSPEMSSMLGVILHKLKKYDECEEKFLEAVELTRNKQGLLNNRSDVMTNLVLLYKDMQNDIDTLSKEKSKYAQPSAIPFKD